MRKFSPIKDIAVDYARKDPDEYFYKVGDIEEKDKIKSKMKINKDISDEKPEEDEREYATRYDRILILKYLYAFGTPCTRYVSEIRRCYVRGTALFNFSLVA